MIVLPLVCFYKAQSFPVRVSGSDFSIHSPFFGGVDSVKYKFFQQIQVYHITEGSDVVAIKNSFTNLLIQPCLYIFNIKAKISLTIMCNITNES